MTMDDSVYVADGNNHVRQRPQLVSIDGNDGGSMLKWTIVYILAALGHHGVTGTAWVNG